MKFSKEINVLLDFLLSPSLPFEIQIEESKIAEIEDLKNKSLFLNIKKEKLHLLQMARVRMSNSIRKSEEVRLYWDRAHHFVMSGIQNDRIFNGKFLKEINSMVLFGSLKKDWGYRNASVYTTNIKHCDHESLEEVMDYFLNEIEKMDDCHPLIKAARLRFGILSIHPFLDANGRTSQLFVDAYLMKAGYLPQSFIHKADGMLIGHPEMKSYLTPHQAFLRFVESVIASYKILQLP